jgi:serine phosphatase RsbU (regulator of sigma subunit)
VWITLADGLGPSTRAAASSAVALGALRASRRSGGSTHEALMLMHRTLREMPGPSAEMTAIVARWDPATFRLEIVNCGHVTPIVIRADRSAERLDVPIRRGLGGRASPRPSELVTTLGPGDRLIVCSDGVIADGDGRAGLGHDQVAEAALLAQDGSAADTVRKVHQAVLDVHQELTDDATVVCLAAA